MVCQSCRWFNNEKDTQARPRCNAIPSLRRSHACQLPKPPNRPSCGWMNIDLGPFIKTRIYTASSQILCILGTCIRSVTRLLPHVRGGHCWNNPLVAPSWAEKLVSVSLDLGIAASTIRYIFMIDMSVKRLPEVGQWTGLGPVISIGKWIESSLPRI